MEAVGPQWSIRRDIGETKKTIAGSRDDLMLKVNTDAAVTGAMRRSEHIDKQTISNFAKKIAQKAVDDFPEVR